MRIGGASRTSTQPPRQKILPLGSVGRTYGDRTLVIGDAAGLVKPTTGGGIHYSIWSAAVAADVAVDALAADRLDAATLVGLRTRSGAIELGEEFEAQRSLRDLVTRLSDQEIDTLFDLARTDGIMPIVRKTARFNQHRHLIRALLQAIRRRAEDSLPDLSSDKNSSTAEDAEDTECYGCPYSAFLGIRSGGEPSPLISS